METRILLILAQPRDSVSQARILRRAITVLSTLEQQDASIGQFWRSEKLQGRPTPNASTLRLNAPLKEFCFQIVYETSSELVAICGEHNTILTILINPCLRTLRRTLYENLVSMNNEVMFKCHVLYAGYTHKRCDWLLDDCTLSAESLQALVNELKRTILAESRKKPLSFGTSPFRMKRASQVQLAGTGTGTGTADSHLKVRYTAVREQQTNSPKIENCRLVKLLSRLLSRSLSNASRSNRLCSPKPASVCFERPTAIICPAGDGDGLLFGVGAYCVALNGGFPQRGSFGAVLRQLRLDALLLTHLGFDTIGALRSVVRDIAASRISCKQIFANWPIGEKLFPASPAPRSNSNSPLRQRSSKRRQSMNVDELKEFEDFMNGLLNASLRVRPFLAAGKRVKFNVLFRKPAGVLLACALNPRPEATEWTKFVHLVNHERNTREMRVGLHEFPITNLVSMALLLVYVEEDTQKVTTVLYPANLPTRSLLKAIDRVARVDLLEVARSALGGDLHCLSPKIASPNVTSPKRQPDFHSFADAAKCDEPQLDMDMDCLDGTDVILNDNDSDKDNAGSQQDFLMYRTILSVGGVVTVLTPITECGEDSDFCAARKLARDLQNVNVNGNGECATGVVELVAESPLHSRSGVEVVQEIIDVSSNDSDIDDDECEA